MAVLAIGFAAESRDFKGLAGNDDDDDAKGFAVNLDGVPVLFGATARISSGRAEVAIS